MKKSFQLGQRAVSIIMNYVFSIIRTKGSKNCSSMAQEVNCSSKKLYKFYEDASSNSEIIKSSLIKKVDKHARNSRRKVLIIDPSSLAKRFAKKTESLAYDFDVIIKKTAQCLSFVAAAWTNGKITIPLDLLFWRNEKSIGPENYKKKSELAMDLVLRLKGLVEFDYVALDGAFASLFMIDFFTTKNINFIMRMPRNRVIIIKNGMKAQLQNHPALKLVRNERCKTILACYKGHWCYFTAHKRKIKKGSAKVVFIISNMNIPPKEQALAYGIRWEVEKIFRTTKQSLGLGHCQATSVEKQRAHIFASFLAYASLMEKKVYKRKKSPEEVLRQIRLQKPCFKNSGLSLLEETIMA